MVKRDQPQIATNGTESVHVMLTRRAPAVKFNAEFKRTLGRFDEFVFIKPQHRIEQRNLRNSSFADTNGADGVGLDKVDGPAVT